jgi:hypothetical protein
MIDRNHFDFNSYFINLMIAILDFHWKRLLVNGSIFLLEHKFYSLSGKHICTI